MHTTFETASTETSNILLLLTEGPNVMVRKKNVEWGEIYPCGHQGGGRTTLCIINMGARRMYVVSLTSQQLYSS